MTYQNWWSGLKAGRCFVTNGPLLLAEADHKQPGYVFIGSERKPLNLNVAVTISRREPVPFLEIVKDGKVVRKVRLDSREDNTLGTQTVDLGRISFERSGWFLVRAVTRTPDDLYRFAMTVTEQQEILNYYSSVEQFWRNLVSQANAE